MTDLHPYVGRDHAVPCLHIGCRRRTWRDDAYCIQHATFAESAAFPPPAPGDGRDAQHASLPSSPERVVHASAPGVEIVRYRSTDGWFVETEFGDRGLTMREAARHAVRLIADGGTWFEGASASGARFDIKVREYGGVPTAMKDCPLAAAIRAGRDDDELMWRIFDDMAETRRVDLLDTPPGTADSRGRQPDGVSGIATNGEPT